MRFACSATTVLADEFRSEREPGLRMRSFFVRCGRATMTQNDLGNGRLVCRIGVAAVRPAEFVIFARSVN